MFHHVFAVVPPPISPFKGERGLGGIKGFRQQDYVRACACVYARVRVCMKLAACLHYFSLYQNSVKYLYSLVCYLELLYICTC